MAMPSNSYTYDPFDYERRRMQAEMAEMDRYARNAQMAQALYGQQSALAQQSPVVQQVPTKPEPNPVLLLTGDDE